jgi:AcrR family transcriptional regulator
MVVTIVSLKKNKLFIAEIFFIKIISISFAGNFFYKNNFHFMDDAKNEILKASLKHFLQHGVRKMSNDNLVALLGISTKTLYKHFKDKEDLLAQALELFYSQQHELFKNIVHKESAPVLLFQIWQHGFEMEFKVNKIFFQDLHYYYPELEKKVEVRNAKSIWKEFIQIINRGKNEGHLREDIIPEVVLEGISVLYVSIVRKGEFKKLGLSPNVILLNTIAAYVRGICTEKGSKTLDKHIAFVNNPQKRSASKKEALMKAKDFHQ